MWSFDTLLCSHGSNGGHKFLSGLFGEHVPSACIPVGGPLGEEVSSSSIYWLIAEIVNVQVFFASLLRISKTSYTTTDQNPPGFL